MNQSNLPQRLTACLILTLCLCAFSSLQAAQTGNYPRSLAAAVDAIARDPNLYASWNVQFESAVKAASSEEIATAVPRLITLTDSSDPKVRGDAVDLLYALIVREVENTRTIDTSVGELLVPYLPRLAPHLTDPAGPVRRMTFVLLSSLDALRPVPPALLQLTLDLLKSPASVQTPVDTTRKSYVQEDPPLGPTLLWIILPAGATFTRDPSTGITVGRDTPEVQAAIIDFIHRKDQTPESRAETLRALTGKQVQNPDVNAALLPWLTGSDPQTQLSLLHSLRGLTFSPEDYTRAQVIVGNIAADPTARAELRSAASALLSCWNNDRNANPCHS